ncbi:MAG TPA: hypothetical protein VNO56_00730 [Gaiellaceae bacterium]|nr:hypothetical protein [Gaiellaceae bacterium]
MQRKLPSPRRFLSTQSRARPAPPRREDDPWAGEDAEWQAELRPREDPTAFARFFRALVLAALVGGLFWAGVVLLILRLL